MESVNTGEKFSLYLDTTSLKKQKKNLGILNILILKLCSEL